MKLEQCEPGRRVIAYGPYGRRTGVVADQTFDNPNGVIWVVQDGGYGAQQYHCFQLRAIRPKPKHQKMIFHPIQPGKFLMGDKKIPTEITKPFSLMSTPVTQWQWEKVMGSNPSHFKGPSHPVETVSWEDCQEFIKRLNDDDGHFIRDEVIPDHKPGMVYRLPTEAEWEYVAQQAENTATASLLKLGDHAWHYDNSNHETHPVGKLLELIVWDGNPFYDLFGNVWEWCQDRYGPLTGGKNPQGPASGSSRVVRGGSWSYIARYCRSAYRSLWCPDFRNHYVGVRLARTGP